MCIYINRRSLYWDASCCDIASVTALRLSLRYGVANVSGCRLRSNSIWFMVVVMRRDLDIGISRRARAWDRLIVFGAVGKYQ